MYKTLINTYALSKQSYSRLECLFLTALEVRLSVCYAISGLTDRQTNTYTHTHTAGLDCLDVVLQVGGGGEGVCVCGCV